MKKLLYISTIIIYLCTLWSCEVEIVPPEMDDNNPFTVTALAVDGEPLNVNLSWTEKIDTALSAPYSDSYVMWRVLNMLDTAEHIIIGSDDTLYYTEDTTLFYDYYKKNVVTDATVSANINGQVIEMNYNPSTLNYENSNYKVKAGDRIRINVTKKKYNKYQEGFKIIESTSQIEVPTHTPDVEIIKTNKIYKECEKYLPLGNKEFAVDSVVVFTLKLKSPNPGINCFRLKVSSIMTSFYTEDDIIPTTITPISAYHSNDVLLYDSSLDKGFGPWPANQTDVFTDESFHNGEYIIDVSSRVSCPYYLTVSDDNDITRYFEIELQPITPMLMNYLSVLYRLRIATPSYFSEPTSLPSNIEGSVGIFGGIGKS
ncbi:MAG: DUF4249 domain-containing protein, partial [Muribaculaceae bacterium]|nr:DUF4249 domain-containing protein [Muribaculaceae bacterium]